VVDLDPRIHCHDADQERGSALLLALGTILVTSMAILLVAGMIQTRRVSFDLQRRNIMLTALVDAAMAETLAGLDQDPTFSGVPEHSLGRGLVSSRVFYVKPKIRRLEATGRVRAWTATIEARILVGASHPIIQEWQFHQAREGG